MRPLSLITIHDELTGPSSLIPPKLVQLNACSVPSASSDVPTTLPWLLIDHAVDMPPSVPMNWIGPPGLCRKAVMPSHAESPTVPTIQPESLMSCTHCAGLFRSVPRSESFQPPIATDQRIPT